MTSNRLPSLMLSQQRQTPTSVVVSYPIAEAFSSAKVRSILHMRRTLAVATRTLRGRLEFETSKEDIEGPRQPMQIGAKGKYRVNGHARLPGFRVASFSLQTKRK